MSVNNIYFVEGVIGAGKSTLLKEIEKLHPTRSHIHVIYEPVDVWEQLGILQEFYGNPSRWSYAFQTTVFVSRIQRICEEIQAHPEADVFLIERSPMADRYLFAELLRQDGCITNMEWKMYELWCETWHTLLPFSTIKGIFYLTLDSSLSSEYVNNSVQLSLQRICQRNRTAEAGITVDYQTKLLQQHETLFSDLERVRDVFRSPEAMVWRICTQKDPISHIVQHVLNIVEESSNSLVFEHVQVGLH